MRKVKRSYQEPGIHPKVRSQVRPERTTRDRHTFEALETRILLTITWTGGGGLNHAWSNGANWSSGVEPAPADDVQFNADAIVTMDTDPQIASLTVNGNSNVVLNFDHSDALLAVTGNITMSQAGEGNQTALTLHAFSGVTGVTVDAANFVVTGNVEGWSNIYIQSGTELGVGDFNFGVNTGGLFVDGTVTANTIELQGKKGSDRSILNAVVHGTLIANQKLVVGDNGWTTLTAENGGYVAAGQLLLANGSQFNVNARGSVTLAATSYMGAGWPAPFSPSNQVVTQSGGAKFTVSANAKVTANTLYVNDGLQGVVNNPTLFISGQGASFDAQSLYVGNAHTTDPNGFTWTAGGQLLVDSGAKLVVHHLLQERDLVPALKFPVDIPSGAEGEIQITGGGIIDASTAAVLIGVDEGGGHALGKLIVTGDGSKLFAHTSLTFGDGHIFTTGTPYQDHDGKYETFRHPSTTVDILAGGLIDAAGVQVVKRFAADLSGGILSAGVLTPDGPDADLIPGDGVTYDDNGNLIPNPSPSDPFGTLTLDGNLDASQGMTLDSLISPTGQSNLLYVTGTVTWGGVTPTGYLASNGGSSYDAAFSTFGQLHVFTTVDSGSAHSGAYALRLAGGHQAQPANAAKLNYQFPNISKLKRLRPAA